MTMSKRGSIIAFVSVTALFFAWGFITNLIDPLIPAVRKIFELSYAESFLTQFAFFIAYGVFSMPGGTLVSRMGYTRTILLALLAMTCACLIFPAATHLRQYELVLLALFILGGGITVLQVAANPLSAALGSSSGSHARLVFSQAFNSLGTVLGPFLGSKMMLSGGVFAAGTLDAEAARSASFRNIDTSFLLVAAMIVALALFVWWASKFINEHAPPATAEKGSVFDALRSKWALLGGMAIFLYVGAEVSIASLMINFLSHPDVMRPTLEVQGGNDLFGLSWFHIDGMPEERAGKYLSICYWGGAMVGRFLGSVLLVKIKAPRLLTVYALVAAVLSFTVSQTGGEFSGWAALSVGLFNSIMFPAIFTITLERSTASTAATSGFLCMAIVGGAILPQIVARIADAGHLHAAYIVPAIAYFVIVVFAAMAARAPIVSHGVAPSAGH